MQQKWWEGASVHPSWAIRSQPTGSKQLGGGWVALESGWLEGISAATGDTAGRGSVKGKKRAELGRQRVTTYLGKRGTSYLDQSSLLLAAFQNLDSAGLPLKLSGPSDDKPIRVCNLALGDWEKKKHGMDLWTKPMCHISQSWSPMPIFSFFFLCLFLVQPYLTLTDWIAQ